MKRSLTHIIGNYFADRNDKWCPYTFKNNKWKKLTVPKNPKSYIFVKMNYQSHTWHSIMLQYKKIEKKPNYECDHINGDRHDNTPSNLRYVSQSTNNRNQLESKGHCWHKSNKNWVAYINIGNDTHKFLGAFHTAKEARKAYVKYAYEHYPEGYPNLKLEYDRIKGEVTNDSKKQLRPINRNGSKKVNVNDPVKCKRK